MSSAVIPAVTVSEPIEGAPSVAAGNVTVFHHIWQRPLKGQIIADGTLSWITSATDVVVSISQVDPQGSPFVGSARFTVHNVAPYNGGIKVWVNIEWDEQLSVRFTYYVSQ